MTLILFCKIVVVFSGINYILKKVMMKKAIFLDRDGVLNETIIKEKKITSPLTLNELKVFPDAKKTLISFKNCGYLLIMVTNQPDIARNTNTKKNVEEINNFLKTYLKIDDAFVCYHDDKDFCNCRKPKPGMLIEASKKYNIDLAKSFIIGDRWRDIEAGKYAKCKTIFIDFKYQEKLKSKPNYTITNIAEAENIIKKFGK
jgi:D-glycero-D-manno-heptose 1,7-bisphosphate phosphatase